MFTGIVQAVGSVTGVEPGNELTRMRFNTSELSLADAQVGDSICVSGACLTAVELKSHEFSADLSPETLAKTSLGKLDLGSSVNLELALRANDRLGGHIVTGHVDACGRMVKRMTEGDTERFWFEIPKDLCRLVAEKGSVTVDGVSLTVNGVTEQHFDVALIPHTLANTTLANLNAGDRVNVEADILARYVVRWRQTEPNS